MKNFRQSKNSHGAGKKEQKTSWGSVAGWYDKLLSGEGTYQKELILPNLLKLMSIKKTDEILDLACGQGFFTYEFAKAGANVTGVDISSELIEIAEKRQVKNTKFIVSKADNLSVFKSNSFDKVSITLALQNISNLDGTIRECYRVLKNGGKLYLVLNHPSFRIPQKSDWGYDDKRKIQYRKVEKYLSESMLKIDMNPGEKNPKYKQYTTSFHRPLMTYFSSFNKAGFLVSQLLEWASNKKSQVGPKQKIEDIARKEIPMFMYIEAVKK